MLDRNKKRLDDLTQKRDIMNADLFKEKWM
jgi:hypothetical protein